MQDIKNLDNRGTPGGFIASEVFKKAADAQADAVGFAPRSLFVAHPIQDRSDDEIIELANDAMDEVLKLACSSGNS